MQKNVPKYTPDWVRTVSMWAEASKREVSYALCNDRRTLLWFANQRAVEYHPTLVRAGRLGPAHPPGARPRPAGRRRVRAGRAGRPRWSARRWPTPAWPGRSRPAAPRACTCSCRSTAGADRRGRGRRDPGPRRPRRAARPGAGHHRVHPGGPGRQGVPRLHPGRRGDRGGRVQPAGPARRAGVVPGALGRSRPGDAPPTSPCTPRRGLLGRRRPVGRARCPRRSRCPPTWSRRAGPSRSPGCRRCTRASAAPAPGAASAARGCAGPRPGTTVSAPSGTARPGRRGPAGSP